MELSYGVWNVGVRDWNRKLFDALIPLPKGTTYNSYLIKGKEKTALIDTVNPGFEEEFLKNIAEFADLKKLDYLIMNHAEPDHAGAIPLILAKTNAKLVTTQKGAEIAAIYYKVQTDRILIVKENSTLNLGGKTLKFIDAPWLHWPETMFTYLVEDRILFSCDFFGSHTAQGFYDDAEDLLIDAQRYFGEIMMPFKAMGKKAIEKIKDFEIKMIAPSHGPIYKNPSKIINAYKMWTNGETKKKAVLVYASMWNSVGSMVRIMAEAMQKEGIEVIVYNLAVADIGDIAKDLVDARAIVLGSPTVLGGMHPLAIYASYLVKALHPPAKYAAVVSTYGWKGAAVAQAAELLGPTGIEIVGALEFQGLAAADISKIVDLALALSSKIKS
jgi:flavorubredoxin